MHRRLRSWLLRLVPTIALMWTFPGAAVAASRLALVVGNAAYPARPLATSAADAGLVAQALAQAGFEVTAAMDLDGKRLRAAFRGFTEQARAAGPTATVVVYLAGYGVQYDGDNYYVPVDATLAHDDDVPLQAANLEDLARALAATPAETRVLVYDLARKNPFAAGDEMPLAPGLALGAPPTNTLIAFDAAPGMVAPDDAPPYGAYARALAEGLGTPGLATARMFERVRLRVGTLTNGAQVPWTEGTLDPGTRPADPSIPPGPPSADTAYAAMIARDSLDGYVDVLHALPDGPLAARARVLLAVRREAATWRAVAASDDPRAAWTYMRRYPRGPHLFDARRRLAVLKAQLEPPPRFDPTILPGLPAPTKGEVDLLAHPAATLAALAPIPAPPATLLPAADPAYGDELPPPAPAAAGVLPISAALPRSGDAEPGEITQTAQDGGSVVTRTSLAPGGAAALTLTGRTGTLATLATIMGRDGTRTILETGPKNVLLSRTMTTRVGDAITTVQTGGSGGILIKITARAEPDGGHTVRVVDGTDALLAEWRRDANGIVVPGEAAREAQAQAPAATAPVPPAPTSPTVAVPPAQMPPPTSPVPGRPAAASPTIAPSATAAPAGPAPQPAAAVRPAPAAAVPEPSATLPRLTPGALAPPPPQAPVPPLSHDTASTPAAPRNVSPRTPEPPAVASPAATPPTSTPPLPPPRPVATKSVPRPVRSDVPPARRATPKARTAKPAESKPAPAKKADAKSKPSLHRKR